MKIARVLIGVVLMALGIAGLLIDYDGIRVARGGALHAINAGVELTLIAAGLICMLPALALEIAPDHDEPLQLEPLHELPDQDEPFQKLPDQLWPAASKSAITAELKGMPKMSCSPWSTTPLTEMWSLPRDASSEPVPVDGALYC